MKSVKRPISVILAILMMLSVFVAVPTTANAAEARTININRNNLNKVGHQESGDMKCFCYALAYARTILDGYARDWSEFRANNGTVAANIGKANYLVTSYSSEKQVYKACYDNVNLGRPCVINVTNKWGGHFVTVIGYSNVNNPNNMNFNNLIILDPAKYGQAKYNVSPVSNNGNGYWLNSYNFYYTNRGGIPVNYSVATGGASNIGNTSATLSGSINMSATVTSWGFKIGTNSNSLSSKTVSNKSVTTTGLSANTSSFSYTLKHGTIYYYQVWAVIGGKTYTGAVKNFKTTSTKPGKATLKTSTANTYTGGIPTFSWNATSTTDSYTIKLVDSEGNEVQTKSGIKGTSVSLNPLNDAGRYTATIYSNNVVGSTTGTSVTVTVHEDSTVTFVDVDPETNEETVLKEQKVKYGKNATPPANPTKTGYTFKRWDTTYNNVTDNITVKSVYEINKYTVKFVNSYTGELLKTETVEYKKSATPPEYTLPSHYVNVGSGWDQDYTSIRDNVTINSVITWGNPNLPMYILQIDTKRFTDTETYSTEGYEVTVSMQNWNQKLTTGRLIVALMDKKGKLLTETESSAFYLKKSATKDVEVFVPYKESVYSVNVYVVDQYSTAIPISENCTSTDIKVIGTEYTYSYDTAPAAGTYDPDSLEVSTEYSYRTKSTTTSYATSMSGWTQNGYSLKQSGSGTIYYVPSFPSGFNRSHSLYTKYNKSPKSASENSTSKVTVSNSNSGYIYYHWCRGTNSGSTCNRLISYNKQGAYTTFHAFERGSALAYQGGSIDAFECPNSSACNDTKWWNSANPNSITIKKNVWTSYNKLYNYYKWSDYSEWSTTAVTANSNTEVKTRKVYKYIPYESQNQAEDPQKNTVKFINKQGWSNVYFYAWGVDGKNVEWPGEKLTVKTINAQGEDQYTVTFDKKFTNIIFSNGSEQTVDITYDNNVTGYYPKQKNGEGKWEVESWQDPNTTGNDSSSQEETSNKNARTFSGKLDVGLAGKHATLFIYKVDSASDYTNEYIAQTIIGEDGGYEFKNVILREEPSVESGDYKVVLNLEGATAPIQLETIKAPKREYTVKFYDYDYSNVNEANPDVEPEKVLVSTQKVTEGENAELPDDKLIGRTGYTFKKWSDSATNVHSDMEITAEYEINQYTVVFVDWNAKTVDIETFDYGETLVAPQPEEADPGTIVKWDAIANGTTKVTNNMVVTTEYTKRKCNVIVTDFNGDVVEEKTVDYGDYVNLPYNSGMDYNGYVVTGWTNEIENDEHHNNEEADEDKLLANSLVTENCYLCPKYEYAETCEQPTADVDSGEYDTAQNITLSCNTENSLIYYTTDGSDPTGKDGKLYTKPFEVKDYATLKFYATAVGMNNSAVVENYYVVNSDDNKSDWMLYDALPDEVKNDTDDEYSVTSKTGYSYKNIKTTSSKQEAQNWENDGWTLLDYSTTAPTANGDTPYEDDDLIGLDNQSEDVYGKGYDFSHYKYELNGEEHICPDADCAPENAENGRVEHYTDTSYTIAGFESFNGTNYTYYVYNGERWYNRTNAQVVTGHQYTYTYQKVRYYKWSSWTVEAPSASETRETVSDTVYSYEFMKHYIVSINMPQGVVDKKIYKSNDKIIFNEEINGYTYGGLYKDDSYQLGWNADTDVVDKSMTLYAKYTPKTYTVQFILPGGDEIDTQEITLGGTADEPDVPQINGYKFVGFNSKEYEYVTKNLTITCIYVPEDEYATIALDKSELNIMTDTMATITAITTPEGVDTEIEWNSSDSGVAIVDSGYVYGVSNGTAEITAKVVSTGETAKCKVTVKRNPDIELTLKDKSALDIDSKTNTLRQLKKNKNTVADIVAEFANANIVIKDASGVTLLDDDKVGTGAVVYLYDNDGKEIDKMTVVMNGDVSGDGNFNLRDASMMSRYLIDDFSDPSDYQIYAMDVNGDGVVNNKDIALILQVLVGKATI